MSTSSTTNQQKTGMVDVEMQQNACQAIDNTNVMNSSEPRRWRRTSLALVGAGIVLSLLTGAIVTTYILTAPREDITVQVIIRPHDSNGIFKSRVSTTPASSSSPRWHVSKREAGGITRHVVHTGTEQFSYATSAITGDLKMFCEVHQVQDEWPLDDVAHMQDYVVAQSLAVLKAPAAFDVSSSRSTCTNCDVDAETENVPWFEICTPNGAELAAGEVRRALRTKGDQRGPCDDSLCSYLENVDWLLTSVAPEEWRSKLAIELSTGHGNATAYVNTVHGAPRIHIVAPLSPTDKLHLVTLDDWEYVYLTSGESLPTSVPRDCHALPAASHFFASDPAHALAEAMNKTVSSTVATHLAVSRNYTLEGLLAALAHAPTPLNITSVEMGTDDTHMYQPCDLAQGQEPSANDTDALVALSSVPEKRRGLFFSAVVAFSTWAISAITSTSGTAVAAGVGATAVAAATVIGATTADPLPQRTPDFSSLVEHTHGNFPGSWSDHITLSGNGCFLQGMCVASANGGYSNYERCTIGFNNFEPGPIYVRSFDTENYFDYITVNNVRYSGEGRSWSSGNYLMGVVPSGQITWYSDHSITKGGWTICFPHGMPAQCPASGSGRRLTADANETPNEPLNAPPKAPVATIATVAGLQQVAGRRLAPDYLMPKFKGLQSGREYHLHTLGEARQYIPGELSGVVQFRDNDPQYQRQGHAIVAWQMDQYGIVHVHTATDNTQEHYGQMAQPTQMGATYAEDFNNDIHLQNQVAHAILTLFAWDPSFWTEVPNCDGPYGFHGVDDQYHDWGASW